MGKWCRRARTSCPDISDLARPALNLAALACTLYWGWCLAIAKEGPPAVAFAAKADGAAASTTMVLPRDTQGD